MVTVVHYAPNFHICYFYCCRDYLSLISESGDEPVDWELEHDIQEAIDASMENSATRYDVCLLPL